MKNLNLLPIILVLTVFSNQTQAQTTITSAQFLDSVNVARQLAVESKEKVEKMRRLVTTQDSLKFENTKDTTALKLAYSQMKNGQDTLNEFPRLATAILQRVVAIKEIDYELIVLEFQIKVNLMRCMKISEFVSNYRKED